MKLIYCSRTVPELEKVRTNHRIMRLIHISLASYLWDIGKQYSSICVVTEHGVSSEATLFAYRNFIEKITPDVPKKLKCTNQNDKDGNGLSTISHKPPAIVQAGLCEFPLPRVGLLEVGM